MTDAIQYILDKQAEHNARVSKIRIMKAKKWAEMRIAIREKHGLPQFDEDMRYVNINSSKGSWRT